MFKETLTFLSQTAQGHTEEPSASTKLNTEHTQLDGMAKCFEIIRNLDSQIEKLSAKCGFESDEDNEKEDEQMQILKKAKMAAYKKLQMFSG